MDIASAVQFLLAYEASLKLAPGQKPPPPSASLFALLSGAFDTVSRELRQADAISGLPPSAWSDWPLCCGVDLNAKELKAARSLPSSKLRDRGLLSLFLALHSCASVGIGRASCLAPDALGIYEHLHNADEDNPAVFPAAHLAARVGHRIINADDTLDFCVHFYSEVSDMWSLYIDVPLNIIAGVEPDRVKTAVPHDAAGICLAKETAAVLDAFSAAQRGSEGDGSSNVFGRGNSGRLPFLMTSKLYYWLDVLLGYTSRSITFHNALFEEAATLPAYDPVLLLRYFYRNIYSGLYRESMSTEELSDHLLCYRALFWSALSYSDVRSKLKPCDANAAMRLGLEDLVRQGPVEQSWSSSFTSFAFYALQSGLVRPELMLRARAQLLEGMVESLTRYHIREKKGHSVLLPLLTLCTRSPSVSFHLRKFFSRSGCLQAAREMSVRSDSWTALMRLLGPRAAQEGSQPLCTVSTLLEAVGALRNLLRTDDFDLGGPALICESISRDLTLDIVREPRHAQPILQYLSELTNALAAAKRPQAQFGVLIVAGLGKTFLAFSNIVARALQDIRVAGPKRKGGKGPGGGGSGGKGTDRSQRGLRARLIGMGRELSSLRRRVLHDLLPLAEAREAAQWEGVREEEVVAALRGDD